MSAGCVADPSIAVDLLSEALRREGAKSVVSSYGHVEFANPGLFGLGRGALLAPISGGSILVSAKSDGLQIAYRLQFLPVFWFALLFGILLALLAGRSGALQLGVISFAWLFFGNVAISLLRFYRFVGRTMATNALPNKSLERGRGG